MKKIEIRRASQFLELSNQIAESNRKVATLLLEIEQERHRNKVDHQLMREEFNRAIKSLAKVSTIAISGTKWEGNDSCIADSVRQHQEPSPKEVIEELQAEVALLNIMLFQRIADVGTHSDSHLHSHSHSHSHTLRIGPG